MVQNIFKNIKKQPFFFAIYAAFLVFMVVILYVYKKTDATLWANKFWSPFQDVFYKYMTHLGDFGMATVVVLFLLFWRFKYAVIALVSFGTSALITQFLKKIIYHDIKRPMYHDDLWGLFTRGEVHLVEGVRQMSDYSFPSGHATSAFSIFCLLALLSKNKWLGIVYIILAVLIGYSRIYLCQHFYEDVFVGSIIGVLVTLLVYSFSENKIFGSWGEKSLLKLK